jgi:hypothetical protein
LKILGKANLGVGATLISFQYHGVPRESPTYAGIDHFMTGKFTDLDININRTTLAVLLRVAKDISDEISQIPLVSAENAAPPPKHEEISLGGLVDKEERRFVVFRMNFTLSAFRISLIKEHKVFLQSSLSEAAVDFDLNGDSTVAVQLSLADMGVKDFYETPWSCAVSTSE